jgi:hypothetical protein
MPRLQHRYCIFLSKEERSALKHLSLSYTKPHIKELSQTLLQYFDELNINPRPIKWYYTKAKFIAKFAPAQEQLAA